MITHDHLTVTGVLILLTLIDGPAWTRAFGAIRYTVICWNAAPHA